MVLFIILGIVVFITFLVLGFLFYMLSKEGQINEEAVPITDFNQLKKALSVHLFEQNISKVFKNKSEIIPVFEAKVNIDPLPPASSIESPEQNEVKLPPLGDDAYKKRAQELEDKLLAIAASADKQSDEAKQLIADLTEENESLKANQDELEGAQQKLLALEQEASGLKAENSALQTQLESTNAKVRLLEDQMAAVKVQMGDEIVRANAAMTELDREKETLLSIPKVEPDEVLRQELDALKFELQGLKQKHEDLEKENQQLQYELVKARAQSSGLERVSFNYKNQLEDFFKKVSAVEVTNDHLSQAKNRLEGMVEQIKSENEDLVKKDQLSQFELEQNRLRLVNLEREYEELKARVQQQGQQ